MWSSTRDSVRKASPGASRGRPPVPLERIVATALRIVDEEGVDALSMRVVARRLDSGTATLYRHVADRAELIAHVVDQVFGEVQITEGELHSIGWQEPCRAVGRAMFDVLSRHRNVTPFLADLVPLGPNAMKIREWSIANFLDHGFPPELAARSWATVAHFVLGLASQLNSHESAQHVNEKRLSVALLELDEAQFPATAAVAGALPVPLIEEFSFGLDLIILGLGQLRDRDQAESART